MKSGGRWNFRGPRLEEDAAAREAARRSGMSVREWLNAVVKPTDADDDERRWSPDQHGGESGPSAPRRREAFRDRETRSRADLSRRRAQPPDDRQDDHARDGGYAHDDGDWAFDRDSEAPVRRRDGGRDEPQRRVWARENDPDWGRRERQQRFHQRTAEESQPPVFAGDDEPDEVGRNGRERARQRDRGDNAEWDRAPRRRASAPPADQRYGADDRARPDSRPYDPPQRWDADAEWRYATRPPASPGNAPPQVRDRPHMSHDHTDYDYASDDDVRPELSDYAAQQEEGRHLRDQQARLERQRRERELFERAAANAISEQRRQSLVDQAVAEIAARQQALDQERAVESAQEGARARDMGAGAAAAELRERPPRAAPREPERNYAPWPEGWRPHAAAEATMAAPQERPRPSYDMPRVAPEPSIDISGLQEQPREMTARFEALRPSSDLENAIVGLRADLADISRSFTEALPRRALEALEIEVKALGQRIDRSRQADPDSKALTGIEHGLAEVREALRGLTPMEGLAGFDSALKAISTKVEAIGTKDDPVAVQQLEVAMHDLRGMIARVASDEALTRVAEDVLALSAKVDQVTGGPSNAPTLAALENRIDILASALSASNEVGHAFPRELEKLLSGLVEKLEWVQLTHTDRTALSHLEDRIAALMKRLDASDGRVGLLEGAERGLADLPVHVERLRETNNAGTAVSAAVPSAMAAPAARADSGSRAPAHSPAAERPQWSEQTIPPERAKLPEPFKQPEPIAGLSPHDGLFDDPHAGSDAGADHGPAPAAGPYGEYSMAELTARPGQIDPIDSALGRPAAARTPIDPNLPPDHPLEPGSTSRSRAATAAPEQVAPADVGPATKPPVIPDPGAGKPDFIAAARRAAQAASVGAAQGKNAAPGGKPKKLSDRLRALAVAAAVVVIVVGGFHIISRLFDDASGSRIDMPSASPPGQSEPPRSQGGPPPVQPDAPARKEPPHVQAEPLPSDRPNLLSPAPLSGEESSQRSTADALETIGPVSPNATPARRDAKVDSRTPESAAPAPGRPMDITGAMPAPPPAARTEPSRVPPAAGGVADKLPVAIGGPNLRTAAVAGDPLAAYEVGVRFAEGKGVPANNEEAAHWLEIAAKKGIVPAQFRLGTLYEKGLGVKKDLIVARDLYRAAADRGHGKAMHNLAVIYAEGSEGKPDYASAAQWFRKAADYGVTDSQYNLAILYARGVGVGVEQNLAESYKWFFLAAREGDQDAAQKRDEIGSRIDRAALATARAAAESWTAIPQPADAVNVKGVWDPPQGGQPAAKPKPRSAKAVPRDVSRIN
jgi:localization factor PodJL